MKKWILSLSFLAVFSGCDVAQQVINQAGVNTGGLSTYEIVNGLKEALTIGTKNSTSDLSQVNGFFTNAAVKILLPPEAQKVQNTLNSIGLGGLVDQAILSINRAAEDAAKSATPIFTDAIKQMTITDALGILKGGDFAATNYFKEKTTASLTTAFKPIIEKSLKNVDATKYWNDVFTAYNRFASKPINTDLSSYVTEKAIEGIFYEVAQEEQKIRQDPAARATELLKKVFGSQQATQP